jgi:O-antigen/teichoic acid export membrane protein
VLPVALVLLGLGVVGVFWGQIAAGLVALIAGVVVYRRLSDRDRLIPPLGELLAGIARPGLPLWEKTRFGLSIAIDKNLVSLYNLIPFLLLGAFASEADVGQLRVAVSYMAIPAVLLSPVSRLLMVDLPQLRATDPARVRRFFVKVTLLGCLASTALAVPFALVAPVFVPLVYGQDFGEASWLVLPLLLDAASLGLGIAAGPIFRTYDRTDLPIRASLVILALGLPAAVLGIRMWGALGAALVYAGMLLASRLVSYVQCLRIVPR